MTEKREEKMGDKEKRTGNERKRREARVEKEIEMMHHLKQ